MGFYGCSFRFGKNTLEDFGLLIYNFGSSSQDDSSEFTAQGEMVYDVVQSRDRINLYGKENKDTLRLNLVFGVNPDRIDTNKWLTRDEIARVANWLTGNGYWDWLSINQEDMVDYRYRVVLDKLELLHNGLYPYAFAAEFAADSSYAYTYPMNFTWVAGDNIFNNRSTNTGYYRPGMTIYFPSGGESFSIINKSDGNREFKFTDLPSSVSEIKVDNENQIIVDVENDLNLYEYFNHNFFRAVKGKNDIVITGNAIVKVRCEFPVNIGV